MNKVKYYRLISGLLLKDLSEKTGLSVGHLSHIENGNKQPSKSAMESIALAVGSTVPEVFYTPLTAEEKAYVTSSVFQAPEDRAIQDRTYLTAA